MIITFFLTWIITTAAPQYLFVGYVNLIKYNIVSTGSCCFTALILTVVTVVVLLHCEYCFTEMILCYSCLWCFDFYFVFFYDKHFSCVGYIILIKFDFCCLFVCLCKLIYNLFVFSFSRFILCFFVACLCSLLLFPII